MKPSLRSPALAAALAISALALGALALGAPAGPALAVPQGSAVPFTPQTDITANPVTPNGAAAPVTLGQGLSASRFLARRDFYGLWKPFGGAQSVDAAGGAQFKAGTSYYATVEAEDDFTAVQLLFANAGTAPYAVTGFAASGSSQWGPNTYGTTGITPYDANGNAIAKLSVGAFGNGGADVDAVPAPLGGNCLTTAPSGSSGSTIAFTASPSAAGWTVGQRLAAYAEPAFLSPLSQVAALDANNPTATVDLPPRNLPGGVKVCALPLGITVPAAPTPGLQAVTYSDWVPVSSVPRIDTPVAAGRAAVLANGTVLGTVSGFTGTAVALGAGLPQRVAKGTAVGFCTATTTGAALNPQATFSFASVPSTVVPGMAWNFPGTEAYLPTAGIPTGKVLAVTATSVTVDAGIPFANSGAQVQFDQPLVVTAISGANLTVAAPGGGPLPANVQVGELLQGTGLPNSYKGGPFANADTISAISGNVVTVAAGAPDPAQLKVGDTIYAVVVLSTNAGIAPPATAISATPSILPGSWLIGAGLPAGTYAVKPTATQTGLSQPTTAAIASGSTLQICNPLTLGADAPAGATTLAFARTTYPKPLLALRFDFASGSVNYWYQSGAVGDLYQAAWSNIPGAARFEAGYCGANNDAVLNPSSVGNVSGGCSHNLNIPVYAVRFKTARRGITTFLVGDSHFQGYTTTEYGNGNFALRGLAPLSGPNLPVWVANFGQAGRDSDTFLGTALAVAKAVRPSVMLLAGWTWNDPFTAQGLAGYLQSLSTVAEATLGWGGLPVVATEYGRAVKGCNSPYNAQGQANLVASVAAEQGPANDNSLPLLNLFALLADPANPGLLSAPYTDDCIHMNDAGAGAAGAALGALLRPYFGD